MLITRTSVLTGVRRQRDLPVTESQMARWADRSGPFVQDCFPDLSDDDREFILHGIVPEEWTAAGDGREEPVAVISLAPRGTSG